MVILLADGSSNFLSDATTYVFPSTEEDEPNAALFSKANLTIFGNGALTVQGNYNDGIASKDGLIIASGTIAVTAIDDGIRGKDYLVVKNGILTVVATASKPTTKKTVPSATSASIPAASTSPPVAMPSRPRRTC